MLYTWISPLATTCTASMYYQVYMFKPSCLKLEIKEFRCYEAKMEKRPAVTGYRTQDTWLELPLSHDSWTTTNSPQSFVSLYILYSYFCSIQQPPLPSEALQFLPWFSNLDKGELWKMNCTVSSTCTYHKQENKGTVVLILTSPPSFPPSLLPFSHRLPAARNITAGCIQLGPA